MVSYQYYIYLVGSGRGGRVHARCTRSQCVSNQIVSTAYHRAHALDDNGIEIPDPCFACEVGKTYYGHSSQDPSEFFEPNLEELNSIVESGGIPLISIWNANLEPYDNDPRIVRYEPGRMKYVALSHVWADGLGNPDRNAIHRCQILFLAVALTRFGVSGTRDPNSPYYWKEGDGRLYFWLDTICVPLGPLSVRQAAIRSISRVFSEAEATLVLSHDLRRTKSPNTALETVTRILVSNWTRRLWTYSEAMLSKSLAFKFGGEWQWLSRALSDLEEQEAQDPRLRFLGATKGLRGAVKTPWTFANNLSDFVDQENRKLLPTQASAIVCLEKIRSFANEQSRTSLRSSEYHKSGLAFLTAVSGLPWKSTSHEFDEFICLAQLCGFDLKPFFDVRGKFNEGMKLLLGFQHTFPRDFAFLRKQHMPEEGWRWAPKSFLGQCVHQRDIEGTRITRQLALLSSEGLVFRYPAIIIAPMRNLPLIKPGSRYWILIPRVIGGGETRDYVHAYELIIESGVDDRLSLPASSSTQLVVIADAPGGLPIYEQTVTRAIVARIRKQEDEIIYATLLGTASLKRLEVSHGFEDFWTFDVDREHKDTLLPCEIKPRDQCWCIS